MTVATSVNRKNYAGNGTTTAFATSPVAFFAAADLIVIEVNDTTGAETTKTLTTHYTVSGGSGEVGTVTMLTAPATGVTLVIIRELEIAQAADFVNNDNSDAEVVEDALDKLTMMAQQLSTEVERSMRFPDGFTGTFDPKIPTGVLGAAGASFIVNDDGDGFTAGPTAGDIADAQENAAAAAASATAAASSETAAAASAAAALTSENNAAATLANAVVKTTFTTKGDLLVGTAASTYERLPAGNNGTQIIADNTATAGRTNWVPRNWISGLLVTNNASDANNDLDIAVGEAAGDAASYMMRLTSALTKQADATWAAGTNQGGMAAGESKPTSGQVNVWLIAKADGTVDVLLNNHATTALNPTLPSGYVTKRLIGSRRTNSSANFIPVKVLEIPGGGERVLITTPALDVNLSNTLGTSRRTDTLPVPAGYKVRVHLRIAFVDAGSSGNAVVCDPDEADVAPSTSAAPMTSQVFLTTSTAAFEQSVYTDTNGAIAARATISTVDTYRVATAGWEWGRRL